MREDRLELDRRYVEVVRVAVVERGADVGPMVVKRRADLLARADDQLGIRTDQLEQRLEALDR